MKKSNKYNYLKRSRFYKIYWLSRNLFNSVISYKLLYKCINHERLYTSKKRYIMSIAWYSKWNHWFQRNNDTVSRATTDFKKKHIFERKKLPMEVLMEELKPM